MSKTMTVEVLRAYLEQTPPDQEIDLNNLASKIRDKNLNEAISFFCGLDEPTKVKYLLYLYNYYYNLLTNSWLLELSADDTNLQRLEDQFIIRFNLDTTSLVGLRRLISRLQKETCRSRHKKDG